jgi:pimeloyl-ACP methyl ester carboxylesterase
LCDGLCCDGYIYKYLWEELQKTCSVAHFHYRGHGRSELPRDATRIDVKAHAADAARVIDSLEASAVVLFGHSLGTQVALEVFRTHRERISGMVLMCGSFGRVTHTFKGTDLLANMLPNLIDWVTQHPKAARALWTRVPVKAALRVAGLLGDINISKVNVGDIAPYFQHAIHVDFEMFLNMLRLAGEHSAEDLLGQVDVPVLIVSGERDTITPPVLSQAMAEAMPNAELFVVPEGTHVAPLEQREVINSEVQRFLNESTVLHRCPPDRDAGEG